MFEHVTSNFRIFGLSTAPMNAFAQFGPNNPFAGSPLETVVNQTKVKLAQKNASDDHAMEQQATKEKLAKVPRPPNAFILYRQEHHPLVKAENPDFHNNDICKLPFTCAKRIKTDTALARVLGKQWQEESQAVREVYRIKALERKAEHLKMHPGYQYAPRKPGAKKHRASRKDKKAGGDEEQYDTLRFIDQGGDLFMESKSGPGSGVGDDAMDAIGTKVDDGLRRFHVDGDGNDGVILPVADNVNVTKMVEGHNKRAEQEEETHDFDPAEDTQVADDDPPHVENDTDFFEGLIDWDAIAEDFKLVQQASGEDLAGLTDVETGNPYLSLSDEDQRSFFEAELEAALLYFH